jgi:DNA primase large subunit
MKKAYNLDDNIISEIARLLQVALLTGTDIIDNLRTIRVERKGDMVTLHEGYIDSQTENIERMLSEAAELAVDDEINITSIDDDDLFN